MSDTTPIPRLSPSIAKILIEKSPMHAYNDHSLLGGNRADKSSEAKDEGLIYESIIFGFGLDNDRFKIIQADDYRTNSAKQLRDEARENNQIPILEKNVQEYLDFGKLLLEKINQQGIYFDGGEFQKHVEWESSSANCHGFIDYWAAKTATVIDLKIVSDASPKKFVRSFVDFGYDIQMAAYIEGIETTMPELAGRVNHLFIACEKEPPHCVQLYNMSGMMMSLGQSKWQWAKDKWAECLSTNHWPGYFEGIGRLEPLPWQINYESIIETNPMED